MLPPGAFTEPVGARVGAGQHLRRRLDLRRPRLGGRRARRLRHPRDRRPRASSWSAARTAGRAPSTTSAATAASRLLEEEEGSVRKRLRCPYHAWSYDLEGNLRAAPHMDEVEDFDPSCFGLRQVRSAVVGGLVLVDLGGEAGPAEDHSASCCRSSSTTASASSRRGGLLDLRGPGQLEGDRRELQRVPPLPRRPPRAERAQRLHERRERLRRRRLVRRLDDPRRRAPRRWAPENGHAGHRPPIATPRGVRPAPHPLLRAVPERAGLAAPRLRDAAHPLAARARTGPTSICEFFFEPATIAAPDFDPSDAIGFWNQVNGEDWHVCELSQKGVASRGLLVGPLLGRGTRRPRLRRDGRRPLHGRPARGGGRMNEIAAQLGEVGLPEPLARPRRPRLGRDRRRRRPQRPHRGRLPGAGRAQRPRPRAPRAARRRLHPGAPVRRRALRGQPLRLRRRPARRAGDARARPPPSRPALLRRRPESLGPVRGRHLLRPVARRLQDPGRPRGDGPLPRATSTATGPTSISSTTSAASSAPAPATPGSATRPSGPRSRRCWAASRR